MKYLFVTGGVISSLGKGLTSACLALLLERRGVKVALMKFDPYLNIDPGTMSPYQHGEVYVTDDGAETDLDLGHYWRYSHSYIGKESSVSSGQIFHEVLLKERKGEYLGKTVQMIPHITDEIKRRIYLCAKRAQAELLIIEIGGTVGDIEAMIFFEAIRQLRQEYPSDSATVHLTYVPFVAAAQELKTKPTQQSVQTLRGIGLVPDLLVCRSEQSLPDPVREKIALFCSVPLECVIEEPDVRGSLLEIPLILHQQKLDELICRKLGLEAGACELDDWRQLLQRLEKPRAHLKVGLVGKYVAQADAYKSIHEALQHAALHQQLQLEVVSIDSELLTGPDACASTLGTLDGCLIPGGFGARGWEGKLEAIRFCREQKIPLLGICLGMQAICVEWARHKLGLTDANSTEFDPETREPIITLLSDLQGVEEIGGTMRLGSYPMQLNSASRLAQAYGKLRICERHRHRFEFNHLRYQKLFEASGITFSAKLEEGRLCEAVELQDHPWMVGVQFHPEFTSRVTEPHPLFMAFVAAMRGS